MLRVLRASVVSEFRILLVTIRKRAEQHQAGINFRPALLEIIFRE